jgi:hypothetical protein
MPSECASAQALHDDEGDALFLPDVEHAHDVVASHLGDRASLARETLHRPRVFRQVRAQKLDRDRSLEVELQAGRHDPHSSATQDAVDAIALGDHPARLEHSRRVGAARGDGAIGHCGRAIAATDFTRTRRRRP